MDRVRPVTEPRRGSRKDLDSRHQGASSARVEKKLIQFNATNLMTLQHPLSSAAIFAPEPQSAETFENITNPFSRLVPFKRRRGPSSRSFRFVAFQRSIQPSPQEMKKCRRWKWNVTQWMRVSFWKEKNTSSFFSGWGERRKKSRVDLCSSCVVNKRDPSSSVEFSRSIRSTVTFIGLSFKRTCSGF